MRILAGVRTPDRGELARAGGWISRAQRLLDDGKHDCVLQGYLLLPVAIRRVIEGDGAAAYATFVQACEIGDRFHDTDLVAMACHGRGRGLIRLGKTAEGVALLDEAMVAVTAGEVSPMIAGDIYCSVIEACHEIFDLRPGAGVDVRIDPLVRVSAGPGALSRPVPGAPCGNHAAAWRLARCHGRSAARVRAALPAARAARPLVRPSTSGPSSFGCAVSSRRRRRRTARPTSMDDGRSRDCRSSAWRRARSMRQRRRSVASWRMRRTAGSRSRLLAAYVEIMLAANDVPAARAAADELSEIAAALDSLFLRAASAQAAGAVLLAEGDARAALAALRQGWTAWHELEAPYEGARTRVLIGSACRQLGDDDSADLELEAARQVFKQLGAAPDLARVDGLSPSGPAGHRATGGLSAREVQVLRLLATGKTNRAIADDLFISEKTVARHVSNIFTKLGLSSQGGCDRVRLSARPLLGPPTQNYPFRATRRFGAFSRSGDTCGA